jgi:hypothetical protein
MNQLKKLWDEESHLERCHERWMNKRNRKQESPDYKDEWYSQQCGGCVFWIPLMGGFSDDYGGCSNASSAFDGQIRFEHDGCDAFKEAEEWGD